MGVCPHNGLPTCGEIKKLIRNANVIARRRNVGRTGYDFRIATGRRSRGLRRRPCRLPLRALSLARAIFVAPAADRRGLHVRRSGSPQVVAGVDGLALLNGREQWLMDISA